MHSCMSYEQRGLYRRAFGFQIVLKKVTMSGKIEVSFDFLSHIIRNVADKTKVTKFHPRGRLHQMFLHPRVYTSWLGALLAKFS